MEYLQKIEYKLVRERVSEYHSKRMNGPRDVHTWFKHLQDSEREKFIVLCLNVKNQVVCFDVISIGSVSQCNVSPREVVKSAILCNASSIILIHNHPSGDCTPSEADRNLTIGLQNACSIFDIKVLDHIIIGNGEFYSIGEKSKTTT